MVTINYTVLYGLNGTENKEIKPNIEFEAFEGDYKVGSYCLVKDLDGNTVTELMAGQVITGIGIVPEPPSKTKVKKQEELQLEEPGKQDGA